MRWHVHFSLTAEALADRDPQVTVTINADDDADAQAFVLDLWPDTELDIVEIEEAE